MWGSVSSVVSGTPLKNRISLNDPFGPPSADCSVVGDDDDERVVELPGVLEVVDDAAELVVGVGDVAREDLGHAGEQPPLVVAERGPRADRVERGPGLAVGPGGRRLAVRVDGRELGARGQDAELDLAGQDRRPDGLVAQVERTLVPVDPLRGAWCGAWPAWGARYMKNGLSGLMTLASRMNPMARSARSFDRWYPSSGCPGASMGWLS